MRAVLLWLLILALPVYGASSSSLRVLGPAHWHSAPVSAAPAASDWLQPALEVVQRVVTRAQQLRSEDDARAHARAHAAGSHHEHASLMRHWHDPRDGSVHVVDSANPAVADLVAGAVVGGAMLAMAAPVPPLTLPARATSDRWPPARASTWADAEPRRVPPPPRG